MDDCFSGVSLQALLSDAKCGRLQLPDFQREWTWDHHRIKCLLTDVAKSCPIGVVTLLSQDGKSVHFKPRPLQGIDCDLFQDEPKALLVDGQQRLTSLYQALMSLSPVQTRDSKGRLVQWSYYIDMKRAVDLEASSGDAIVVFQEAQVMDPRGGGGDGLGTKGFRAGIRGGFVPHQHDLPKI